MQKSADTTTLFFENEEQTQAFAARLAQRLLAHAADIAAAGFNLRLTGDLGAGKTTLTRALLRACGVTGPVRSPTFELVQNYELTGGLQFNHFDFYRFESPEEFDDAGFRELFGPGRITACEWSERAGEYLPAVDLVVTLTVQGLSRSAEITAESALGAAILKEVCA